jgi:hypothetical protein
MFCSIYTLNPMFCSIYTLNPKPYVLQVHRTSLLDIYRDNCEELNMPVRPKHPKP